MRELLSGALPAPQDEPQHRDVIDAAMDWGTHRRRRDWVLSGAAALAVVAVGTGVAAMSGGSGNSVTTGAGPQPSSTHRSMGVPSQPGGSWWTSSCDTPGTIKGNLADYCGLYNEEQNFNVAFARGSLKYIQEALPAGFTVKATASWVLILTGPNGKTNYLFPSTESASTLGGNPLSCGTPPQPGCVQTSTAGGNVVVNGAPSGDPSAGYVGSGLTDPRVDIVVGTSATGGLNGMAPPTSALPLLSNAQLEKVLTDPGFLAYAKAQLHDLQDIMHRLQSMAPPSISSSGPAGRPPSGFSPSGHPSSGATDSSSSPSGSWSSPGYPSGGSPAGTESSGNPSWSSPSGPGSSGSSGVTSGWSRPSNTGTSGMSSPGVPVSSGS